MSDLTDEPLELPLTSETAEELGLKPTKHRIPIFDIDENGNIFQVDDLEINVVAEEKEDAPLEPPDELGSPL